MDHYQKFEKKLTQENKKHRDFQRELDDLRAKELSLLKEIEELQKNQNEQIKLQA
jgi:peptidoglycan hydrolase CwlO-like protein